MTSNPATAPPTIVNYKLSDGDVAAIVDQLPRDTGGVRRNQVLAGDVYPALVVRTFDPSVTTSNLQVFLDGNCTYWATSRAEGDQPGTWARPPRETAPAPTGPATKARFSPEGQVAYEAYCKAVGGVSVHGDALWSYQEMRELKSKVAEAWNRAGEAVALLFTTKA